ncbi:MAG: hypothetical protein HQ478_12575 [Chloroflexi bacterium]|nr:hypothetical protein [Chloroflexota bacterium]
MPHQTKNKLHDLIFTALLVVFLVLVGCGGSSVDDVRATSLDTAVSEWAVSLDTLTIELRSIINEETAFGSLLAVRDQIKDVQRAIEPLGALDDNDASYLEDNYGPELKEIRHQFSGEAQRLRINGEIPSEISELLRDVPEFGPR